MRKIIYLFVFAVVLLVLKAFVLDEYIERYYNKDANTTSAEANATVEAVQSEPEPQTIEEDTNASEADSEKNISNEKKKPPLEQLGDEFSKRIKL